MQLRSQAQKIIRLRNANELQTGKKFSRFICNRVKHTPMQAIRSFRFLCAALFGLVALWLATGCQPAQENQSDITLSWEIEPEPPTVGASTITVVLQDSTDRPVEGAQVTLEGNMSHPGMQPVIVRATETEPGRYSAEMELGMAGDWFITVSSTLEDSTTTEHQIDLPGVRPE